MQFPEEQEADGDGRQHHRLERGDDDRSWWRQDVPLARTALVCATAVGTTLIHVHAQHQLARELINAYLTARGCDPV